MVAVLTYNRLYVANVGDSRAILAYEECDGSIQVKQLSEDHGIENERELERLMAVGLDREQLKKSGRLGTQENTRSIGDYSIKGGYKDACGCTKVILDAKQKHLGCKKCGANQKQHCKQAGATKRFDIKKLL